MSSSPGSDLEVHKALVTWLSTPAALPDAASGVEHIETHISHLFLSRSFVYKLKKPVKYDFLDFSTLGAREHACREEVRLNRRLAPQTYLGVVAITLETDGGFALSGRGAVVDWLVQMQRLPEDRMLDTMYHRGLLRHGHIDSLAELLDEFYARASTAAILPEKYRLRYLDHVQDNLHELIAASHHLPRAMVQRVHSFQLQLLHCHPEIFAARVRAKRIIDGHGDLRPEHICLTEPITIFDCIEFSREFRQLDVADELAFLSAECDDIGANWVGPQLLSRFQELSGDRPPAMLWDFYRAYRASVRAKVAVLRADQLAGSDREKAAGEATRHLALADSYAKPYLRPLMLVVGGLSGTGKTTLARELASALGAELLRSDVVRQELAIKQTSDFDVDRRQYSQASRDHVYQEMFRRAAELHAQSVSVVLDATFSHATWLRMAHALVTHFKGVFLAVECHCQPRVAQDRIISRRKAGQDSSDANVDVYKQQQQTWQHWPEELRQRRIDTEQPLLTQCEQVIAELSRALSA